MPKKSLYKFPKKASDIDFSNFDIKGMIPDIPKSISKYWTKDENGEPIEVIPPQEDEGLFREIERRVIETELPFQGTDEEGNIVAVIPIKISAHTKSITSEEVFNLASTIGDYVKTIQVSVNYDCTMKISYAGDQPAVSFPAGLKSSNPITIKGEELLIESIIITPSTSHTTTVNIFYATGVVDFEGIGGYDRTSSMVTGNGTAANVAAQITTTSTETKTIIVKCLLGSPEALFVGESATNYKYVVDQGESVAFDFPDLSDVYVFSTGGTATYCYMYIK